MPVVREAAAEYLTKEDVPQVHEIVAQYAAYARLLDPSKRVLMELCNDFLSENISTDVELAAKAGVHRNTVHNCKHNPMFNEALIQIMPEMVKAKLPKYLQSIAKHGERDWNALKFLLEYAGLYVSKRQQLNISAQVDTRRPSESFQDTVDDVLTLIGSAGWTEERMVERFRQLKTEGAF